MNSEDTSQQQDTVPVQNPATGAVKRIPKSELPFAIRYHGAKQISEAQYSAGFSKFGKPPSAGKPSAGLDAQGKPLYSIPGKAGPVLSDKPPLSQQPVAGAGGTGAPAGGTPQQDFGPGPGMAQMVLGMGKQIGREGINLAQMVDPTMGGVKSAMQTGPGQALESALKPKGSYQEFGADAADVLEYMLPAGGEEKVAAKAGELLERFAPKIVSAAERKMAESGILATLTRQGVKQGEQIIKSVYQAVTGGATGAVQGRDPAKSAKDAAVTSLVLGNLGRMSGPLVRTMFNVKDIRGGDVGQKLLDISGVTRKKLAQTSARELQRVEGRIAAALPAPTSKVGQTITKVQFNIHNLLDGIEKMTFDPKIPTGEADKIKGLLNEVERFSDSVAPGRVKTLSAQRVNKITSIRNMKGRLTTETNPIVRQSLKDGIKVRQEEVDRIGQLLKNQPAMVSAPKLNNFRKTLQEHYMPYGIAPSEQTEADKAAKWAHDQVVGALVKNRPEVEQLLKDSYGLRDIRGAMEREERKSFGLHTIMDPTQLPRTLPPWLAWEATRPRLGTTAALAATIAAGGARAPIAAGAKALASPFTKGFATGVENIMDNPSKLSFGPENPDEVKKKGPYGNMD